jgi:GDPmannose 4,6-dehydratase
VNQSDFNTSTAIVIGASGQDGYFLTERLVEENWKVHATVRRSEALEKLAESEKVRGQLQIHQVDLENPGNLFDLIARERPEEIYNLAGQSSVSRSFAEPLLTWRTNADFVALLLECVRVETPQSRLYQASSTDMFGSGNNGPLLCNEESALNPQSPYASAKAAAHLLCRSYREDYNLRITCGILSNHESHRRRDYFLTRKIADHVRRLRGLKPDEQTGTPRLKMGNLRIRRDWGFAPDYVEGMRLILRQIKVRAALTGRAASVKAHEALIVDEGRAYRDYVLGTGKTYAVWELVDTAFRLIGLDLEWSLEGDDPRRWQAHFRSSGKLAVEVDPLLLRPADPFLIEVDPSRARRDLGWSPRQGLETLLTDMLDESELSRSHGKRE